MPVSGQAKLPEAVVQISPQALFDADAPEIVRFPGAGDPDVKQPLRTDLILPNDPGFLQYTRHVTALAADICARVDELRHVDMRRVLLTLTRCRSERPWGYQAKLTPLRFRDGVLREVRRGHLYQVQRFFIGQIELHYVLSLYVPRFLNQSFDEKLVTIFHELFHISPEFTGDIRRFGPARTSHDRSQREYDLKMAALAKRYLLSKPSRRRLDFLRLNWDEVAAHFGGLAGVVIPAPKLIPVSRLSSEASQSKAVVR